MSLARPINQLSNSLSSSLLFSLTSLSFHPRCLCVPSPGPGPGKPVLRSQLAAEKAPPAHPHNHVLYTAATAPASTLLHLHVHAAASWSCMCRRGRVPSLVSCGGACVGVVAIAIAMLRAAVARASPALRPPAPHSILVALQLRVARSHSRSLPLRLAETLTLCPCLYIHARPLSGHPFSSRPRPVFSFPRALISRCALSPTPP